MGGSVPQIPGNKAQGELVEVLRKDVADLLGRSTRGFPGAQPVSFSARHLHELRLHDYYVTEKSDGIRCLLFCTHGDDEKQEIHYLIDRKNDYYYVPNLHFPAADDPNFEKWHTDTIVDGELVMDTMKDGSERMKYLVFDCLVLDGYSLRDRPLDKRLAYFREKMFLPYEAFAKQYPDYVAQNFPFTVEFKASQKSYGVEMMFRELIPRLKHGNDGLIFTCRETSYKFGTDEHILKWKPPNENSVDFRLRLEFPLLDPDSEDEEDGITSPFPDYTVMPTFNLLVLQSGGSYSRYGTMYMEEPEWEALKALEKPLDDTIVECVQDPQKRWRFLRFREDKKDANHISTVESVMESISDGITEADLIRNAKSIRDYWKKREAAETDPKRKVELEAGRRFAEAEEARKGASRNGTPNLVGSKRGADELEGRRDSDKRQRPEGETNDRIGPELVPRPKDNGIPTPEGSITTSLKGLADEKRGPYDDSGSREGSTTEEPLSRDDV